MLDLRSARLATAVATMFFTSSLVFIHPVLAEETVKIQSYDIPETLPSEMASWKSKVIQVRAQVHMPDGVTKPPVVLYLMHSGGFEGDDKVWVDRFLRKGFAVVVLDQYTDRGMSLSEGLGSAQVGMSDAAFLADVFGALRYIHDNPKLDGARVMTFGRSWGAGIQVYLTQKFFVDAIGDASLLPKAGVGVSPACYFTTEKPVPTGMKLKMLLGAEDNWNAPGPCNEYAGRYRAAGGTIDTVMFPGVGHVFDFEKKPKYSNVLIWGRCDITYDPSTKQIADKISGASYPLDKDNWDKIWECAVKDKALSSGTADSERKVLDIVNTTLAEVKG